MTRFWSLSFDAPVPRVTETRSTKILCVCNCRLEQGLEQYEVIATTNQGEEHVVATGVPILKDKRMFIFNVCHQLVQTEIYHEGGKSATQLRIWGWLQHFLGQPVACPKPTFECSHDAARILEAFDVVPQDAATTSGHASGSNHAAQAPVAPVVPSGAAARAVSTGATGASQSQAQRTGSLPDRSAFARSAPPVATAAAAAPVPQTTEPPTSTQLDFMGVSLTRFGRWRATANVRGNTQSLGTFCTPEEAAGAYDRCIVAEWRLGVGRTNFPLSSYLDIFYGVPLPCEPQCLSRVLSVAS